MWQLELSFPWVIWHPAGIFRMGLTWVCQPLFQDVSANVNGSCMNTKLCINVSTWCSYLSLFRAMWITFLEMLPSLLGEKSNSKSSIVEDYCMLTSMGGQVLLSTMSVLFFFFVAKVKIDSSHTRDSGLSRKSGVISSMLSFCWSTQMRK